MWASTTDDNAVYEQSDKRMCQLINIRGTSSAGIRRTPETEREDVGMKLNQLVSYVRDYGIRQGAVMALDRIRGRKTAVVSYNEWQNRTRLSSFDYLKMEKTRFPKNPVIGITASMREEDRTSFLQSLHLQIYRNYKALKRDPHCEYVLVAEGSCTFKPEFLWECASLLSAEGGNDIGLVYFDSDVIGEDGCKCRPAFRPDFDPDLLERVNYMGNVVLVRSDLAHEAGLPAPGQAAFHRFLKQVCLDPAHPGDGGRGRTTVHIPKVLYHQTEESETFFGLREAAPACAEGEEPLISVLIPNRDHAEELERCVESLRTVNTWQRLEILILENNSAEEGTFALYEKLKAEDSRIRVLTWDKPFNYSAINNFGASHANGEYLLLLNNDTQILEADSIARMQVLAGKPSVGAVGALLLYPDRRVQHGGIILGHGGIAGHAWEGECPLEEADPFPRLVFSHTHNVCAVTGACMMLKKTNWESVGGMDESLGVTFNDVDLCMRLRREGLRILMCPDAGLIHNESASRGSEDTPQKVERFHQEIRVFVHRWADELEKGDPFYNPNLTLTGRSWTCRDELREAVKPYRKYLHL